MRTPAGSPSPRRETVAADRTTWPPLAEKIRAEVADKLGLTQSGFRLVFNNGLDAGEAVPHLHCHILGGRHMSWPPG